MSPDTPIAKAEPVDLNSSGLRQPYHLVDPSPYPLLGSGAALLTVIGIVRVAHESSYVVLALGILSVLLVMFFWWRSVIKESRTPGLHSPVVRLGLRYGMTLFISSEVMFFVAFFWAYFHFALYPEHVLDATSAPMWPPAGINTFDPFHFPFMNTLILLLSGCTVTWAHHALIEGDRKHLIMGLGLTILLGMAFTCFQYIEYSDAPFKLFTANTTDVYPSVFFLATGFHGFHVIVGTAFLIVCWFRARAGQFTPARHFGFEAAAWYWHFVDVVWLFLFFSIYLWGAGPVAAE